jgi:MtaA/CmuA family methyltransferase
MNEKDRLLNTLNLKEVDRIPCVSPLQTGTLDLMEASGANWPEAHDDPEAMARLALAANTVAGIESVRVPFDVTVDATAFGAVTGKATRDRQPSILEEPITTPESLEQADIPDPHSDGRAPVVIDAVRRLSSELSDVPVICAIISPFMLAGQLRGTQDAIMEVMLKPDFMHGILDKASDWGVTYSLAAMEAGADVISMVDATASGDVLGPSQYEEFALPYQKRIVDAVHSKGGKVVLHICGKTSKNIDLMAATGTDGITVDQQMDIGWVKEQLRGKCATIGNVSPTSTLLRKKPKDVMAESKACIEAGTDVLAPGCGFAPETPLPNMKALVDSAKRFGVKQ